MDAGRWLCILLALCIISIFALKAHAATPRTLLDTLDAGSGNVWVNASNPRYLRFSTGDANAVVSEISMRIADTYGAAVPTVRLCDDASANCQQFIHQDISGSNVYRFTGAYQVTANRFVRIIFDCACDTPSGYGVYMGSRTVPGASTAAPGYLFAAKVVALALPTVHLAAPAAGPSSGGTTVILTGTGLLDTSRIRFGNVDAAHFQVDSDTQITAITPLHPGGTVSMELTTSANAASTSGNFTFVASPSITAIGPASGPTAGGTIVTLTGTGFAAAAATGAVRFGSTPATYTILGDTRISATAPAAAAAGTVDITVTTPGGISTTGAADQFTYVAAPSVTAISPAGGPSAGGTRVTVSGTQLTGANTVMFGAHAATDVTVISATQLTAVSPPGTGSVDLTVSTPGGTSVANGTALFRYAGLPGITALSTQRGPVGGGTPVVITGSDFTGATSVRFGTASATGFTVDSATRITAVAPPGSPGLVDVSVTTPEGTSATAPAAQFRYQPTAASLQFPRGQVQMRITGADCSFEGTPSAGTIHSSDVPPGFEAPYGQIAFQASGCTSGGVLRVALTLPEKPAPGSAIYKQVGGRWVKWAASMDGANLEFSVTDNTGSSTAEATGDNDPAPGRIDDPIMVAIALAPAAPAPIPSLGLWALVLLSMALGGLAVRGLHRVPFDPSQEWVRRARR
ncbi:IPT/TIG domain [Delftia tsuruhatensis]|nr:IPT/TIG domain [Delftia tsuruhatensis]CAC9687091.1 IPT/TIG domain [Delftia tsuruhatensis]